MTDVVTIDGVNILTTYGVGIAEGSYKELVGWPALKTVEGNEWQEVNGFEPDLSEPMLDTRNLTLRFILNGSATDIVNFYHFLGGAPTREFTFARIGRTLTLRLVAMQSPTYAITFHILNVQFAADTPLEGYTYAAPVSSLATNNEYVIDDTPISAYGIRVLQGTISSVITGADVKPFLVRSGKVIRGAEYNLNPLLYNPSGSGYAPAASEYDGVSGNWKRSTTTGTVTYRGRDITLHCLLKEATAEAAWRNYDALLYDLTKVNNGASSSTLAGARTIDVRALGLSFLCYYKGQSVEDFYVCDDFVWIKFNFTLSLFQEEGSTSFF